MEISNERYWEKRECEEEERPEARICDDQHEQNYTVATDYGDGDKLRVLGFADFVPGLVGVIQRIYDCGETGELEICVARRIRGPPTALHRFLISSFFLCVVLPYVRHPNDTSNRTSSLSPFSFSSIFTKIQDISNSTSC